MALWAISLLLGIAGLICRFAYRIFLHPLRSYPGPLFAAISNLPYIKWSVTGQLYLRMRQLHDRYGEVVRIRPNSLAYRNPQAWTDIYGNRKHPFPKDPEFYLPSSSGAAHIVNANEVDHSRFKRLLMASFSERSLREQEGLIMQYIDLFIDRLQSNATSGYAIDMAHWFNFLTFDIIGDLSFGEPFGCLQDSRYHPWVKTIFHSIKTGAFLRALSIYPTLSRAAQSLMPRSLLQKRINHYQFSKNRVGQRLAISSTRPDFISYILRHNDEKGMSSSEMEVNAAILIQAGSETTATALAACTFYLATSPDAYSRLAHVVRQAFATDEEITFLAVSKLPFLNAVIEESLRLYPPLPAVQPRVVPEGGACVIGRYLPAGTSVSVPFFSAQRAYSNFADPDSFRPERWLPQPSDSLFAGDHRYASQPFSVGTRSCIGRNLAYAEMRTILAKLLFHFDLALDDPSLTDWDHTRSYIVWENRPLHVRLTPVRR